MSPLPPPDRTHRTRRRGDIARGLAALTALVVFLVGVPLALSVVAPLGWPESWPTWDRLSAALTRPDDGGLLLGAITLVAWAAWTAFAISTATEIVAGIRHVSAPSIPLLRMTQRAAATLIATAGLLVTTTTPTLPAAAAAPRALMAVAVPVDDSNGAPATSGMTAAMTQRSRSMTGSSRAMTDGGRAMTPAGSPRVAPAPTSVEAAGPVITVARGDTLWGLAERHLGDGHRYVEIYDLNAGRPQADGGALSDTHWIYPGWQLRLPVGATDVAATQATPADDLGPATTEQAVHDVVSGDTLWDIATTHLGDGARYPEIYDLNAGRPQADGRTLTDPDLINPGWVLALPTQVVDATAEAPTTTPDIAPAVGTQVPSTVTPLDTDAQHLPEQHGAPDQAAPPNHEAGPDNAPRVNAASDDASEEVPPDDDAPVPLGQFFLGLTALAAAGVIGELARRRHLQHRTRRTGARISLPAPGSLTDDAERTLRSAATPLSMAQIKAALLNLATRCYAAERDLPRVGTLLLSAHILELHLVEDDSEPVEPFASTGPRTWSASTATVADDEWLDDDPGRPEPYPTLVTLGHTDEATVIINLEAAGTLTVNGDPGAARAVLRAVVAELATGDLAGRVGLITGPEFAGLAGASDSARLQCVDPATLAAMHSQRDKAASEVLGAAGVEDTLQARSDRTAEDLWLPVIYLDDSLALDPPWGPVTPWSGSVLLTTSAQPGTWTLTVHSDGSSTLEPTGDRLFAQRLTATDLERLTDLLATATPAREADYGIVGAARAVADDITDALAALPAVTTPAGQRFGRDSQGLRIKVLGPIEIEGLPPGDKPLSKRSTELLVYLALRGKATGPELDEALWHGRRVDNQTRNSLVYRTRQRVGADALPLVDAEGLYRLGAGVTCDWHEFHAHAREGLATGPAALDQLHAALDLVRNRPFLGISGADYTWAEHDIQQMISAIADAAHVLSQLLRENGDDRLALEVATQGLLVEPYAEALQADATRAAQARGDTDEAERLDSRFAALLGELDPDLAG